MRIGCEVITWGMYEGGEFTTEQVLRQVRECGYEGFEGFWGLYEAFLPEPSRFQDLLDSIGLALASLYVGGRFWDPATRAAELNDLRKVAHFLDAMDCDCLVCGSADVAGGEEAEVLGRLCQTLNEAGAIAADCGLKLCLHPHAGSMIERPDQLRRVMENTDPEKVFLAPDNGHIQKGGGDALWTHRHYLSRIAYVHFKDVTADGRWTLLGQGASEYPEILRILQEAGYGGWIIGEEESDEIQSLGPKECCRRNFEYLAPLIRGK